VKEQSTPVLSGPLYWLVSVWLASKRSGASEPDEHESQKRQTDEGFAGARQPLIIAGQSPAPDQPGKGVVMQKILSSSETSIF